MMMNDTECVYICNYFSVDCYVVKTSKTPNRTVLVYTDMG